MTSLGERQKNQRQHQLGSRVHEIASLPPYPTFDYETDKTNAGPRWEKWVNRLDNLFVGLNITNDARKRALLLHYAGERVHEIFDAEKSQHDSE